MPNRMIPLLGSPSSTRAFLLLRGTSDFAVLAAEKQQGLAFPNYDVLNFSDENRVISCILRGTQAAFQVRQRAMQDRRAMLGAIESCAGFFLRVLMRAGRLGVVVGDFALSVCKY